MANLKGSGVPTRTTLGAIGDIYTDTTTGKQYKCTFAYCTHGDQEFDCQWVELKGKKVDVKPEPVAEKKPVEEKPTEAPKPETQEPPKQSTKPNRTNYAAYNKKQN